MISSNVEDLPQERRSVLGSMKITTQRPKCPTQQILLLLCYFFVLGLLFVCLYFAGVVFVLFCFVFMGRFKTEIQTEKLPIQQMNSKFTFTFQEVFNVFMIF